MNTPAIQSFSRSFCFTPVNREYAIHVVPVYVCVLYSTWSKILTVFPSRPFLGTTRQSLTRFATPVNREYAVHVV